MDPKQDNLVKELINDAIVAMAKLKEVAPNYWRAVLIALKNEEKKDGEQPAEKTSSRRRAHVLSPPPARAA